MTVPAAEGDADVVLNTVPGETTVDIGSSDSAAVADIGLGTGVFRGVLGSLAVDQVALPLWSFSKSTRCDGAAAPPKTAPTGFVFKWVKNFFCRSKIR